MKYHTNLYPKIKELKGTAIRRHTWHAEGGRISKSWPIEIAHIKTARGTIMFSYCLMQETLFIDDSPVFQLSKYPDTVMEFSL